MADFLSFIGFVFFFFRKLSYFTGKLALNDAAGKSRRASEDSNRGARDLESSLIKSCDTSLMVAESNSDGDEGSGERPCDNIERPIDPSYRFIKPDENCVTNSDLTTPYCWSRHAALLDPFVAHETAGNVSRWNVEQVVQFVAKFGISAKDLDRIKDEVIFTV